MNMNIQTTASMCPEENCLHMILRGDDLDAKDLIANTAVQQVVQGGLSQGRFKGIPHGSHGS